MLTVLSARRRSARAFVVLAAATVAVAGSMVGVAQAAPLPAGTYLVCPDIAGSSAIISDSGCISMATALTDVFSDNAASAGTATLDLLPGHYCPITLPYGYRSVVFQGVGDAGYADDGASETGPEVGDSAFVLVPGCQSTATSLVSFTSMFNTDWFEDSSLEFENIAFLGNGEDDGTGLSSMTPHDAPISFRDDLFENFSGYGLYYGGDNVEQQVGFDISNSAFLDNSTGLFLEGYSSVNASTVAGNNIGLEPDGNDNFAFDTITANGTGVQVAGGSEDQVNDTIVAANTTDCGGSVGYGGDWESSAMFDDENLQGATCMNGQNNADGTDTLYSASSGGFGSLITSGITPYYNPPAQAVGATPDNFFADQEEAKPPSATDYDIGAIQTTATNTPSLQIYPGTTVDFGTVPSNQSGTASVTLVNTGNGIVGVQSITSTNPDFTITSDNCTYNLLIDVMDTDGCSTYLTFRPSGTTTETATLQIETTNGERDVDLTGEVGPPVYAPGMPTDVKAAVGDDSVTLSWKPPSSNGGSDITGYDVRISDDGGKTWGEYDTTYSTDTSYTSNDLSDGTVYVAEVAAENQYYTYSNGSPWSESTQKFEPTAPPTTSGFTAPKNVTIADGHSATLFTTFTDHGEAIGNVSLNLLEKPAGSSKFSKVGTATTNIAGYASTSVKPSINTVYEFTYAGGNGVPPTTSKPATVTVDRGVRAALARSSVKHGKTDDVYGTVSPSTKGLKVTLQLKTSKGWTSTGATAKVEHQKLPNGKTELGYVIDYKPKAKGKQTLRVVAAKTSTNGVGSSASFSLRVD